MVDLRKYLLKEWNENENPLQHMADLVGKGGKYENKPLANHLKKQYGVSSKAKLSIKAVLDMLEDHNYHNEYALLSALKSGKGKNVEILLMISKQHEKTGSLDFDLGALRYYISNPASFKRTYGIDDHYKGMKISASTMKIVNKMSKKQQKEFLDTFKKEE